jgi:hypothetical protein
VPRSSTTRVSHICVGLMIDKNLMLSPAFSRVSGRMYVVKISVLKHSQGFFPWIVLIKRDKPLEKQDAKPSVTATHVCGVIADTVSLVQIPEAVSTRYSRRLRYVLGWSHDRRSGYSQHSPSATCLRRFRPKLSQNTTCSHSSK